MTAARIEAFGLIAAIHKFDVAQLRRETAERRQRLIDLGWPDAGFSLDDWVADFLERAQSEIATGLNP